MFKKISLVLLILGCLCFNSAVPAVENSLVFIIHPYLAPIELHKKFTPLAEYLSRSIGQPIEILIATGYDDHIAQIGSNKADIAFIGPAPYTELVAKYGKKPILARLEINGKATYRGIIVVSQKSQIRLLSELKGKRFAFGDRNSTMAHLIPAYMLWKAGIAPGRLANYEYLGGHENVALGVLSGNFDAGAMKEDIFPVYQSRGLKILERTPEIPVQLLIASDRVSKKTVQRLRAALFALSPNEQGKAVLKSINADVTGMTSGKDEDYDSLRAILARIKELGLTR